MCDTNTYIAFKAPSMSHCDIYIFYIVHSTCKMTSSSESWVTIQSFMQAVNFTAAKIHTSAVFVTATADQHTTFWHDWYRTVVKGSMGVMYRNRCISIRSTCRNHMKLIPAILTVLLEQIQSESIQLHVASSCHLTPPPVKQAHFQKTQCTDCTKVFLDFKV